MDEYWLISSDEWTNFKDELSPGIGSISEDIEYLKKAIVEEAMYTYSNFDRSATILRAISEIHEKTQMKIFEE
jgi:hypothetical protein